MRGPLSKPNTCLIQTDACQIARRFGRTTPFRQFSAFPCSSLCIALMPKMMHLQSDRVLGLVQLALRGFPTGTFVIVQHLQDAACCDLLDNCTSYLDILVLLASPVVT